jgi:cobalt-zinc-cadmium efflux system protein
MAGHHEHHESHQGAHQHRAPQAFGAHGPDDASHRHAHEFRPEHRRALLFSLVLTGGFAIVEVVGGWLANSLALISDAGHMAADAGALLIALLAARLAARPVSETNSFGYGRAEVIGAFVNALTMLAIVVWIIVEAVTRVFKPLPIAGGTVMVVAVIGLFVNIVVLWVLSHDHGGLNSRAAAIHVLGDLLGSVAAIIAGAVVHFTGWTLIDPILSVLVALLILRSTWSLARDSVNVLMEAVPDGLDYRGVGQALAGIDGVVSVHDLHVWQMSAERRALSAHLLLRQSHDWPVVLKGARAMLQNKFGIDHVTLQPEWLGQATTQRVGKIIPVKVRHAGQHDKEHHKHG